jgi:hypothetical protein
VHDFFINFPEPPLTLAAKTEGAETSSTDKAQDIDHAHLLDEKLLRGVHNGLVTSGHGDGGEGKDGGVMTIVTDNGAYIELLAGEVMTMRKDGIFKAAAAASAVAEYWGQNTTTREGGGIVSSGMPEVRHQRLSVSSMPLLLSRAHVCVVSVLTLCHSLICWSSLELPQRRLVF